MFNNNYISAITQYADISMFLGADEYEIEKYYNWVDETDRLELIYILNDVIKYYQPYLQGTPNFDRVVNLLYSLCGKWIAQAEVISGNKNGIIVGLPIQPVSTATGTGQIEIIVGTTGGPIPDQGNSYTNSILINRTIIVVVDGVVLQPNLLYQNSYSFNAALGTIIFNNNLNMNQVVSIIYM
jgi:hypothetical protein